MLNQDNLNQDLINGSQQDIDMPADQPTNKEYEMKQDIERKLSDVNSQNDALETKKFIAKNKLKNYKIEMLRNVYKMLEQAGVNPNDPNSIKEFLLMLEQQDPDLLTIFETIFDVMSPDTVTGIDTLLQNSVAEEPTDNLMNKYNNLQGQIMR